MLQMNKSGMRDLRDFEVVFFCSPPKSSEAQRFKNCLVDKISLKAETVNNAFIKSCYRLFLRFSADHS